MNGDLEPQMLVSLSLTFPNVGTATVAELIGPLIVEALKSGAQTVNFGLQPYDPDS